MICLEITHDQKKGWNPISRRDWLSRSLEDTSTKTYLLPWVPCRTQDESKHDDPPRPKLYGKPSPGRCLLLHVK